MVKVTYPGSKCLAVVQEIESWTAAYEPKVTAVPLPSQEVQRDVAQARQYFADFERQERKGPLKWLPIKIPGIN